MGSPQVSKSAAGLEPGKVFSAPLGAASPLWLAFMGAASAGVAFWWLTRWVKPFNLEAAHAEPKAEPLLEAAPIAEPVVEAPAAKVEAEPVFEPVLEAVSDEVAVVAEAAGEVLAEAAPLIETGSFVELEAAPAIDAVDAEPDIKPAPAKAAPRKRPPAPSAARISARTKRRQPEPAPKGPPKRR